MSIFKKLKAGGHLNTSFPEAKMTRVVFQKQQVGVIEDEGKLGASLLDLGKIALQSLEDGKLDTHELVAIGVALVNTVKSAATGKKPIEPLPEPSAEHTAETVEVVVSPVDSFPDEDLGEAPFRAGAVEAPVEVEKKSRGKKKS